MDEASIKGVSASLSGDRDESQARPQNQGIHEMWAAYLIFWSKRAREERIREHRAHHLVLHTLHLAMHVREGVPTASRKHN